MQRFRFIHCSDLHIDSPFKGLRAMSPALLERLRESTFESYQNIVRLALRERVDAVILAGDIYDSRDKSLRAQIKFRNGLQELSRAGIPSFVAHGNHDALDSWSASLAWPQGATQFSGNEVQRVAVARDGRELAHVYGISFAQREIKDNLALQFQRQPHPGFAVGVLHTNVGSNTGHDNYAPCSVEDLLSANLDYWALGHIHARQVLRERSPAIVYSGNTQARSMKEAQPKGCYMVTLQPEGPPHIQFVPTDVVRFLSAQMDLSQAATLEDVLGAILEKCEGIVSQAEEHDWMIRLTLTGRSPTHLELSKPGAIDHLTEETQRAFEERRINVGIELISEVHGLYEIDALRRGNDFIADLLGLYDETEESDNLGELRETLKPLFEKWQGTGKLEPVSEPRFRDLLRKARDRTLDRLVE